VRHRFYLQLYVALLGSAFVCLLATGIAFRVARDAGGPPSERMQDAARVLPDRLPSVRAPDARKRLAAVSDEFGVDIIAGDAAGPLIGVPSPRAFAVPRHLTPGLGRDRAGPVLMIALGDDDWAALRPRLAYRRLRMHPFFTTLVILALVMAVGAYPVARRVTRRLEALANGVDRWGEGALKARVPVDGNDEISRLAATFNRAADRLDALLEQQKHMVATASHELRSPLARIRMGLELVSEEPDAERRQARVDQLHGDVVELDGLIEELLLHARADGRTAPRPAQPVDLQALIGEEAARTGATVQDGPPVTIEGDAVMLRHMVRNVLENAQRHGANVPDAPPAVRAAIAVDGTNARLSVDDDGPGIPEEDRERVFAPFFRRRGGAGAPSGHGLGLALVRQVARYHGGDAACLGNPRGPGARFEITLPLARTA
jgi:signal transduction histidine kinase